MENIASEIPYENRFTTKEEITSRVAFLLSGKTSPIKRQQIHVDRGFVNLDGAIH